MASSRGMSASEREEVEAFVHKHSEMVRAQRDGDPEATVEGYFPPDISPERGMEMLLASARFFKPCEASLLYTDKGPPKRFHVFWARELPCSESLGEFREGEGLAELRKLLDFMIVTVPLKALEGDNLELAAAVAKPRRAYLEAIALYNPLTATEPKPRLINFLLPNEKIKALMWAVLGHRGWFLPAEYPPGYGARDSIVQRGFLDGLMGESVSEYGYTPSKLGLVAYSCGCIIAGRTLPSAPFPTADEVGKMIGRRSELRQVVTQLPELAAEVGNLAVLQQLHANGWDVSKRVESVLFAAGVGGHREILAWLHTFGAAVLRDSEEQAFAQLLACGHFETARWMVEALGFDVRWFLRSEASARVSSAPSRHNNLDALKWLHEEQGFPLHEDIARSACTQNNKEMLEWYFSVHEAQRGKDGSGWNWMALADGLRAGHTDISLSLLQNVRPEHGLHPGVLAAACEGCNGDPGILDTLMSAQPPLFLRTMSDGAPLPWHRDDWFSGVAHEALQRGFTRVLDWVAKQPGKEGWLRDPASVGFREALDSAVSEGCVDSVSWLLNRATAERLVAMTSMPSGKPSPVVDALSFTLQDGCPSALLDLLAPYYELSAFYRATLDSLDIDLFRRLNEMGYRLKLEERLEKTLLALLASGPGARPKLLPFLSFLARECGVNLARLRSSCQRVASGGSTEVMALLIEQGAKLSSDVLAAAAKYGQLPMCRWLRQQGVEWPADIVEKARSEGADEVAAWIEEDQAKEESSASASEVANAGAGKA